MKFFQIILIFILGGCSYSKEEYNFLGTVPYYVINDNNPPLCKPVAPKELHKNFIKVKKSKKSS